MPSSAPPVESGTLVADLYAVLCQLTRTSQDFLRAVDGLDLSLTQLKLLHLLDDRADERSVKSLAERLGLSLGAASRAVDGLHGRGLVERHEDHSDRRVKRVCLTRDGEEALAHLTEVRMSALEDLVSHLTITERDALSAALAPVLARLGGAGCTTEEPSR